MTRLSIYLLGTFHVLYEDQPVSDFRSEREKALLAYLALERDRPHGRDELTGLLWPELPEKKARNNLRVTLHRLRNALAATAGEAELLLVGRDAVQVNPAADLWLDVTAVEDHLRQASNFNQARGPVAPERLAHLAAAADLYGDEFLKGFALDFSPALAHWVSTRREKLHRLALRALHDLAEICLRRGELRQALLFARRQLELEPWREEAHRQLMGILARSGESSAALAQYERCRQILAEELGVEPAHETHALYQRLRAMRRQRFDNLPAEPTPFVGRTEEVAEITWRLADPACRLLTLVGPGGIGKSRLALRAAANQAPAYLHGVAFARLSGVSGPEFLLPALVQALELESSGGDDPAGQLLDYLRQKEMLLLLDSFEHLLNGRKLLSDILQATPGVKLLVTSRERLNLWEEWVFVVDGLPYPPEESDRPEEYGAVQLFLQSARRVNAAYTAVKKELACVAGICRLVEGTPLAIELSAAWTRALSCAELRRDLEQSLTFLESPWADRPQRHRSLAATFNYSWRLLTNEEQETLARLSVFQGDFDRAAAAQVAGASLPLLTSLVDKSLLRQVEEGNDRYHLHDLIREFAAARLAAVPDEEAATHGRHGRYYTGWLGQLTRHIGSEQQHEALTKVGQEIENVRAAYLWAVEQRVVEAIGDSLTVLIYFYEMVGPFREAERMFSLAVASLEPDDAPAASLPPAEMRVLAAALTCQSWYCMRLGQAAQATALAHRALAMSRRLEDQEGEAFVLDALGAAYLVQGDLVMARKYLEECVSLAEKIRHHVKWGANSMLARIALNKGDLARARRHVEASLALARQRNEPWAIAGTLRGLANVAIAAGDLAEAESLLQESLALYQAIKVRWRQADIFISLARIAVRRGDYAQAIAHYQESLALVREAGERNRMAEISSLLGEAYLALDELGEAGPCFREALATAQEIEAQTAVLRAQAGLAALLAREGKADQAVEQLGAVLVHPATEQTVRERAGRLLAELADNG
jgi:predicted ATPase/DNA-binding SARP family transcriptional activator